MTLDELLDTLQCLRDQPRRVTPLEGGLTNTSYRVTTPERDVVVRVPIQEGSVLTIDRDAEYANSRSAAMSGAAPEVIEYSAEHSLLVVAYVSARMLTPGDLRDGGMLAHVGAVCRQLHAGPRFVTDVDIFEVQAGYLRTVLANGFKLPDGYLELMPTVERCRGAMATDDVATLPCHNDLVAANILDDGKRLWLIDYEYAGNNDPCFELGNLASDSSLDADELSALVTGYFGTELPHKVARTHLLGAMAQYSWALWASLQEATNEIHFDSCSGGLDAYRRAVETLGGPKLDALLSAAQCPD